MTGGNLENTGNKINYQRELEKTIKIWSEENKLPTILLHCCCAPCSSYCMEYLSRYSLITAFYYNPNITDTAEYNHRAAELERLINEMPMEHKPAFVNADYEPDAFYAMSRGLEQVPEGGVRCFGCYRLRLEKTAQFAALNGYDYFTTTLTISPLKNAQVLNQIGLELGEKYGVKYLTSDFKKNNGYKRSIELSQQYGLYRQNYCGCGFSKRNETQQ